MYDTNDLTRFGTRLDHAMHHAGMRKNTTLAQQAEVTEGTIRNWLSRDSPPSGKTRALTRIAESLGVSLSWLEHGIGPMILGAHESSSPYRANNGLSTAKRIILRALEADLARMTDEQAEAWYVNYQKTMDKAK